MQTESRTYTWEEIYEYIKLRDRISPGRTPWQTLRKRADDQWLAQFNK